MQRLNRAGMLAILLCVGFFPNFLQAVDKVVLQLKWRHQFQFAGYYTARELGYYADAGLDVEIRPATPGLDPVDEVASGRAQFGIGSSELIINRYNGKDVVVLAAICQHSPYAVLVPESSPIKTVHELTGKRIMFEPQAAEIEAFLRNEGVNNFFKITHSHNPLDIVTGRADAMTAYVTTEPFFLRHAGVETRRFLPEQGGGFLQRLLFGTEIVDGNPRWSDGSVRPASRVGAMPSRDRSRSSISSRAAMTGSPAFLEFEMKEMRKLVLPELVDIGHINPGRWRHIADTYAELGLLPKNYSLDGFIWTSDEGDGSSRLQWVFAAGLTALLLILGIVLPIVRINRRLREGEARRQALFDSSPLPIA